MRIRSKTLFSKISPPATRAEAKKINFFLEKLFRQTKNKEPNAFKNLPNTNAPLSTEEKGLEEAVKSHAGKAEKNRQAVEDMVNNSNRILIKISAVFPWEFFPSSIVVEETRITIIHRQLFSSQVHSVDIKNISNVFLDTGILFAQLTIVSDTFAENQILVDRLWKKEAIFARRIIEGLRMFIEKDIDTTSYKTEELVNKLRELSTTRIVL